jgi:hypothetical protein
MKRLLLIFMSSLILTTSLATFSSGVHAAADQQDVKDYLRVYRWMLNHLNNYQTTSQNHLLSGSYTDMKGPQLKASLEVLQLIYDGELDTCCWNANSAAYAGMPSATGQSITNTTNTQYNYTDSNGNAQWITLGTDQKDDYRAMKDILDIAATKFGTYSSSNTSFEKMKHYENWLILELIPLWQDLRWSFSYSDASVYTDLDLQQDFRLRYAFACIVCFKAGFYDTSNLHNLTNDSNGNLINATPTAEYNRIFALLSNDTQTWMNSQASKQYPDTVNWNGKAPIQVSTGPTWQASKGSTRGNLNSDKHIYPTHCHGATELYKTLDPMLIVQDIGSAAQKTDATSKLPYTVTGSGDQVWTYTSIFSSATFVKNMYPEWQNRNMSGVPNYGSFRWTGGNVGALFYNGERDYHSMHNGRWVQLNQWARLTSPNEGTNFPKHSTNINPSSPNGDGCNG